MVYLFIFESIGTQELILIGIIAMIFLGPRKLPEYAKKIGKMMAEFRGTAQDFRTTWEREVNFEEEAEAIRSGELRETKPIPRIKTADNDEPDAAEQMIKTIDRNAFDELRDEGVRETDTDLDAPETIDATGDATLSSDKRNWL